MVPHVDDRFSRSMDPLKVYEYLAAGKPVVASGLADMGEPPGTVVRADGPERFVRAVMRALGERVGDRVDSRAFARARSWDRRVDEMIEHVTSLGSEGRWIA
jgi:hypothetical protein